MSTKSTVSTKSTTGTKSTKSTKSTDIITSLACSGLHSLSARKQNARGSGSRADGVMVRW